MQSFPADLTTHDVHFEPTVEILPSRTKGHDLAPLKTKYPLPPTMNMGAFHAWAGRKLGPKIAKNQFTPLFFPTNVSLSSFSVPAASSTLENPTETFLLHQQMAAQPPYEPKSSSVVEQPPRTPFSLLFFSPWSTPTTVPSKDAWHDQNIDVLFQVQECRNNK